MLKQARHIELLGLIDIVKVKILAGNRMEGLVRRPQTDLNLKQA
jgi:hypothetical protein